MVVSGWFFFPVTYNNYSLMVPIPALVGQELNATVNMTVELQ